MQGFHNPNPLTWVFFLPPCKVPAPNGASSHGKVTACAASSFSAAPVETRKMSALCLRGCQAPAGLPCKHSALRRNQRPGFAGYNTDTSPSLLPFLGEAFWELSGALRVPARAGGLCSGCWLITSACSFFPPLFAFCPHRRGAACVCVCPWRSCACLCHSAVTRPVTRREASAGRD